MREPGLDRHEWATEFESLEPQLQESPSGALPDLAELVERMLIARGYNLEEPVTKEGDDPDVVKEYLAAREVADRCEAGDGADPGDIAQAIEGLRSIYAYLLAERSAP